MERFRRRTGLDYSAVMVPPHGACSEAILSAMPSTGYAAACVSSGSLAFHNVDRPWTRLLGFKNVECVGGCPVIPRWGLKNGVDVSVILAAYLGQAIVIMGHHQDMADDLVEFDRVAGHINSLGSVAWSDMHTLSQVAADQPGTTLPDTFDPSLRRGLAHGNPGFGSIPVMAGMRRIATEARDRLAPVYCRLFTS
jgi:hypothetical protein